MDEKMIERVKQFLMAEDGMLIDIEPKYAELLAKEFVTNGYGHIPTVIREVRKKIDFELRTFWGEKLKVQDLSAGGVAYPNGVLDCLNLFRKIINKIGKEYEK